MLIYTFVLGIVATMVSSVLFQIYRLQAFITDRALISENIKALHKAIRDDMYLSDILLVETATGDLVLTSTFSAVPTVRYVLQDAQVMRIPENGTAVAVTTETVEVYNFTVESLSTTSASGAIKISVGLRNYERGLIKPPVSQDLSSVLSIKYVL